MGEGFDSTDFHVAPLCLQRYGERAGLSFRDFRAAGELQGVEVFAEELKRAVRRKCRLRNVYLDVGLVDAVAPVEQQLAFDLAVGVRLDDPCLLVCRFVADLDFVAFRHARRVFQPDHAEAVMHFVVFGGNRRVV